MTITRRALLGRAATAALFWTPLARATAGRAATLRVGIVRPADSHVGTGGVLLGIDEATASARLFGRSVQARTVEVARTRVGEAVRSALELPCDVLVSLLPGATECAALVSETAAVASGAVPVLNTACSADVLRGTECSPHLFHVAASDAMQRDALRLAGADDAGRAVMWHHTLERYGAGQLNARCVARNGRGMEDGDWAAWMALKIAVEGFLRTDREGPGALRATLESDRSRFDGHKGVALSFRKWDRQLRQPLYVVGTASTRSSRGAGTEPVESPPRDAASGAADPATRLDLLGTGSSDSSCRAPTP